MAAAAEARGGEFPVGMKVLVVDDDPTCLLVLKKMLDSCKYDVTTCPQATRALTMLWENRHGFDVIISDVHMPDMDGFRLLERVGLEMDLPVIMMSADSSTNTVMKGITHGACDYLIKPVRMEELRSIWQHVVRKKWSENKDHKHSDSIDDTDLKRPTNTDDEYASCANDVGDGNWKSQKKKQDKEDDEVDENGDPSSTSKKPRVVWSIELYKQFLNAVNHLGIDRKIFATCSCGSYSGLEINKAVPKKNLELMNVPGLTRENVASHLQRAIIVVATSVTRDQLPHLSLIYGDRTEEEAASREKLEELDKDIHALRFEISELALDTTEPGDVESWQLVEVCHPLPEK